MKKFLIPLTILLLGVLIFTSCGKSTPTPTPTPTTKPTATTSATPTTTAKPTALPTPTATPKPTPKYGGTLKILNALSPANPVGWPLENNMQSFWYICFLYAEPLFVYTHAGTVEPWLAESWEFSANYSNITFHLRKGVRFQDGTEFNADAVKFQLDKVIEAKSANAANWQSVDIVDNFTVRLNLTKFTNAFWGDMYQTNCFFVSPTPYREKGEDWVKTHPVGTGPFRLVAFEKDQYAKFEKNTNYWQPGKPYLDKVECLVVKDIVTQQMSMQAGQGHVMSLQDGKTLSEMKKLGFNIIQYPAGTSLLVPDSKNPDSVFADIRVRQAINYAIDKKAVADATGYGYMFASSQLPPLGNPARVASIPDNSYDPVKAKQLLADAGYSTGFKTKLITWSYDVNYALVVQQQLAKVGIETDLQNLDNLKFIDLWMNGWQGGLLCLSQSFGPNFAGAFKSQFPPYGIFNVSMKVPAGMQDLIDQCLAATDLAKQTELNQKLVKLMYDDMMVIPYMTGGLGHIISPKVMDGDWIFGSDMFYSWRPADCWLNE